MEIVWTFDAGGRVTQFTSADGTATYGYDDTNQLTSETYVPASGASVPSDQTNAYDANGNRTNTGYTTGANNQLTNDGTFSYTYDAEGNRTQRTEIASGAVTEYAWDYRNRLTRVTNKDSVGAVTQVVEYTYDVFNRRIEKAVDVTSPFDLQDAAIERYILDDANGIASDAGGNVILDFVDADGPAGPASSALSTRRLFGNAVDQILAEENVAELITSPSRISWPLVDNLGTVRDIARNDATIATHFTYDAFGQVLTGDTTLTRYLYASREFDSATGLYYNRARYYDAAIGRFISEDPIGFAAGDANIVRYVGNHPTNATDPSGLEVSSTPYKPYWRHDSGWDLVNPKAWIDWSVEWTYGVTVNFNDYEQDTHMRQIRKDAAADDAWKNGGSPDVYNDNLHWTGSDFAAVSGLVETELTFYSVVASGGTVCPSASAGASLIDDAATGASKASRLRTKKGWFSWLRRSKTATGSVTMAESSPAWAGKLVRQYANKVKGVDGFTDVFIHGTSDGKAFSVIHNGEQAILNHRQIAKWLKSKNVSCDIRLISCYSGSRPTGGVAQNLANKLGVTVRAPTNAVNVHSNGALSAPPGTVWRDFTPGVR